ncbi:hypothetical protein [Embleya sp. NPDC001921]
MVFVVVDMGAERRFRVRGDGRRRDGGHDDSDGATAFWADRAIAWRVRRGPAGGRP